MSDIKFACPHCGQHIACDSDFGDLAIDCPGCKNGMVVPRLTAAEAGHPELVLVASSPATRRVPPPMRAPSKAWTEEEWAIQSRNFPDKNAAVPHFSICLFGTLMVGLILKVSRTDPGSIIGFLVVGAGLSSVLMVRQWKSQGPLSVLKGVGMIMALCLLVPVVAVGILFLGCAAACR
jgi:hypothetical protein